MLNAELHQARDFIRGPRESNRRGLGRIDLGPILPVSLELGRLPGQEVLGETFIDGGKESGGKLFHPLVLPRGRRGPQRPSTASGATLLTVELRVHVLADA